MIISGMQKLTLVDYQIKEQDIQNDSLELQIKILRNKMQSMYDLIKDLKELLPEPEIKNQIKKLKNENTKQKQELKTYKNKEKTFTNKKDFNKQRKKRGAIKKWQKLQKE